MKTKLIAAGIMSAVLLAAAPTAFAQRHYDPYGHQPYDNRNDQRQYGPRDEGRTFRDGSRVECWNEQSARDTRDPNRVAGTATGAIIGGLIGNQIGSGSGRKVATIGGAVAGGAIGRHVQGERQEDRGQRHTQRVCDRVWR